MGQFKDLNFDYSAVTLEEGFLLWAKNGGKRARIGYGYTCCGTVTPGPHWSGMWVDTRGMGNHGTHVIIPVSEQAKDLVRQHEAKEVLMKETALRELELMRAAEAEADYERLICGLKLLRDRRSGVLFQSHADGQYYIEDDSADRRDYRDPIVTNYGSDYSRKMLTNYRMSRMTTATA